jgi:hypothetical protein
MLQNGSLSAERTILRGGERFYVYSWIDQLITQYGTFFYVTIFPSMYHFLLAQIPLWEILLLEEIPG